MGKKHASRDQEPVRPSTIGELDCVSAVKEAMEFRWSLHVMALLQGIKKLFGPLLDDLDCVSAIKEAMELQVEACMRWPSAR